MSSVDIQRVFTIDYGVFRREEGLFHENGTFVERSRQMFIEENADLGEEEILTMIRVHEQYAAQEIAKIIKAKINLRPETDTEQKARQLAAFRQQNLEMAELKRDLKFWDNNSHQ
jgi:hypothetical protein